MSLECIKCKHGLRGGHADDCPRKRGVNMLRVDYTADELKDLGKGSIVTTPDEMVVAIKLTNVMWSVSGQDHIVIDHRMHRVSEEWSNVRTILK